jgi:hypothetical protein
VTFGAEILSEDDLLPGVRSMLRLVSVEVSMTEGTKLVTVFDPKNGPTYRDMLPEPPPAEFAPSCAEAGVLGVLPGIVGSIQALEAIKLILGLGEGLSGRLVAFVALDMTFREYRLQKDPTLEVTWENRDLIEITELDGLCMPKVSEPPPG